MMKMNSRSGYVANEDMRGPVVGDGAREARRVPSLSSPMSLRFGRLREHLEHDFVGRAHARNRATDLGDQRVLDYASARLLVAARSGENALRQSSVAGSATGRPARATASRRRSRGARRRDAEPLAELRFEHHPDRDRLAVQQRKSLSDSIAWPSVWPKLRLRRIPPSRSSCSTMLALISTLRTMSARIALAARLGEQRRQRAVELEVRGVGDRAVLDRLGEPRAQMIRRERREHGGIGDDRARPVEGADEIFPGRRVDPRLPADRCVDHREQRRRQLHERNAAHVRRGDEAREIADDAAAERDNGRVASEAGGEQRVGERAPTARASCAPRRRES